MIFYHSGRYISDTVQLPVRSPAFRFGSGFYETILFNRTAPCRLKLHMRRMCSSLEHFDISHTPPDAETVIHEIVQRNNLNSTVARINIYALMESDTGPASFVITARKYEYSPDTVLRLHPCPYPWVGPLTEHKCMNGMFLSHAAQAAASAGFEDALLMNTEGVLLETHRASLLFHDGSSFIEPPETGRLFGTAAHITRSLLDIQPRKIVMDDLASVQHVYALNALMGMKPVTRIGEHVFEPDWSTCESITAEIHQPDKP